jgi:ribosome-binding protein aMBF1 (putative translation factor)
MPGVFKHRTLARLVERKGLNNRDLAALVHANQGTVARWIKGDALPSPSFIARLAEVLAVEPSDLYRVAEAARGLAYYRVIAGYSLAHLAPKVGTSPVHLGRMEAGYSAIPDHVRQRLQEVLGLDDQTMKGAMPDHKTGSAQRRAHRLATKPVPVEFVRGQYKHLVGI